MTIAITLKVNDGLVLAADSATTIPLVNQDGKFVGTWGVYNNANKVFNLYRGLPIGAATWGLGVIGNASIALICKEFRGRLMGTNHRGETWKIDPHRYAIEDVAEKFCRYIYSERYLGFFAGAESSPPLGFFLGGYSTGSEMAEEFIIEVNDSGSCLGPRRLRPAEQGGITWNGQTEAITRLLMGYGTGLAPILTQHLGVGPADVPVVLDFITRQLGAEVYHPLMPIQDAIDLAAFLADLSARYSRFTPGPTTVGGEIEIAAMTKHEGFRWVRRKHYYDQALNPTPSVVHSVPAVKLMRRETRGRETRRFTEERHD